MSQYHQVKSVFLFIVVWWWVCELQRCQCCWGSSPPTYEFVNLMILGHGRTLFSNVSSVLKISRKIKSLICIQQNRLFPCY